MTDAEIITQLRSFFQMKGWPVLREAADRLESFAVASAPDAGNLGGVTVEAAGPNECPYAWIDRQ
jgi:hypothetical protein